MKCWFDWMTEWIKCNFPHFLSSEDSFIFDRRKVTSVKSNYQSVLSLFHHWWMDDIDVDKHEFLDEKNIQTLVPYFFSYQTLVQYILVVVQKERVIGRWFSTNYILHLNRFVFVNFWKESIFVLCFGLVNLNSIEMFSSN